MLSGSEPRIEGVVFPLRLDSRIIVSIRGTQVELDVLRDLIIQPSRLNGGLVHRGMRDQADDVITLLKPYIELPVHQSVLLRLSVLRVGESAPAAIGLRGQCAEHARSGAANELERDAPPARVVRQGELGGSD